eukprot:COSAG01_NODE_58140_length_307_cov_245.942308_1_plen_65_part_10
MIKVLYEAGHRPDKMGLLIKVSWIFLNGDMGPSNFLLFSTQSSCRAPISAVRAAAAPPRRCYRPP